MILKYSRMSPGHIFSKMIDCFYDAKTASDSRRRSQKNRQNAQRCRFLKETDPDLTISIHLNSFLQDTDVYGAQVFYPQDAQGDVLEENIDLAQTMQEAL